ncbi:MAG: hypothetical protein ABI435_02180 [Pseudolysinimonas sp.]
MNRLVRLASVFLPRSVRDRYREQWLADLRDAPEAGIPRGQIARGALAFALAAPRPLPTVSLDPYRMRRLAFALAFVGAALGLTYYPGFENGHPLPTAFALAKFTIDMLVQGVEVIGTLAAIVLISAVRGVSVRERASVWLLALAAVAPLGPTLLGYGDGDFYLYPGALSFVVAIGLIATAVALRRPRPTRARSTPRAIALATMGIALLAGSALALAAVGWVTRIPLVTNEPIGSPLYEEWLSIKTGFEEQVGALLLTSLIVAVAIVVGVAVVGIRHRLFDLRTAVAAAVFLIVFGYVQLSQYFGLWTPTFGLAEATPTVLSVLRLALVVTVFIAVDGIHVPRTERIAGVA